MSKLTQKKVAILATNGFEQSELMQPMEALKAEGADVHVISPEAGEIRGWDEDDWGRTVAVDLTLANADPADYDALVLPGGQINPDVLRTKPEALDFIKAVFNAKKPLAAICHAPWLLAETGIAKGRKLTSFPSIRTDLENAGAHWEDSEVVVDEGLITSRDPGDLDAFNAKIIEEICEGRHEDRAA